MTTTETTEHVPWLCDVCSLAPPAIRYDLPENLTLMRAYDPQKESMTEMLSAGFFGVCKECRRVMSLPNAPDRLADRVLKHSSHLKSLSKADRRAAHRHLSKLYFKVLSLMRNPRPAVMGEHPSDCKIRWVETQVPQGSRDDQ